MKIIKKIWIFFSSTFLVTLIALGAVASDSCNIGKYIFDSGFSNTPLTAIMGSNGLSSLAFVGQVGGVAFEALATPDTNLASNLVSLAYNSRQRDGRRLEVTIGNKTYNTDVPDWQLIPIANYADSQYTASVSLFGPEAIPGESYHVTYHPAFKDTLLGLRLMQADSMFIDLNEFWKLPQFGDEVIRGQGESRQNPQNWENAASEIT